VALSLGLLLAIFIALYRVFVSFQERDAAQEALRATNEGLENAVERRTQEIVDANQLLKEQIAERIKTQDALACALDEIRVDREKLDEILRSVPDGVVVADDSLNVLHMNAAAERILGLSLDDLLGQPIGKLNDNVDFTDKIRQRLNIVHGLRAFDIELPCGQSQEICVYQVRVSQFVPEEGTSPGIVLLIRDVTREREIDRMKNAFLGMAAHELNTPLATIIGYAELLTAKETSGNFSHQQQEDYLRLIHDKALALGGLIDDLLDISRVESGQQLPLNYQQFDLKEKVSTVLQSYRDGDGDHEFELVLPAEEAHICADEARLEQVLEHLVSNAVKYSPGGGVVRIELVLRDSAYGLSFTDQGIGMNEEQLAHIYDRFYRVDSTDTAVQGVGLGMSIVRHIVQAHSGEINIESHLGRGTKVSITLPVMPPQGTAEKSQPFKS
jgi:PAS domain S-box-containing protein